jgi:endonuclease YncB( thermonuclease family)
LFLLLALPAPATQAACPPLPQATDVVVARVIDGDTVVLSDNRHIRLIGINAMELGHGRGPDQPYAEEARARLMELMAGTHDRIRLRLGEQEFDYHHRTLAYLSAPDGRDYGEELLRTGLAVLIADPPNLDRLDCYTAAESEARGRHLGIWSADSPLLVQAASVNPVPGDFLIARGTVTDVTSLRAGVRLLLDGRLTLWIPTADLPRFRVNPGDLLGRRLLVRGWVRDYKGQAELDVHAQAALLVNN